MPSATTQSGGHSHPLHITIPNSSSPRVPPVTDALVALDTPGHSHGLFVLPRSQSHLADDAEASTPGHSHPLTTLDTPGHSHPLTVLDTPGHSHGLFRFPPSSVATPTTPKLSARVARRSSLFSLHDADEPSRAGEAPDAHELTLPPTSEAEEPSTAELDASFEDETGGKLHADGDNSGGNNGAVQARN